VSAAAPPQLAALGELYAPLADLRALEALLFWDQNTMMPARGAPARAEASATIERIAHEHLTDPEIGRLLDSLDGWLDGADPDSEDVRLVRAARRDFEKAVRVPADLAAEFSHASALGQQAWVEARAASDFRLFRDALARQIELRHRYVACFEGYEHAYDVLLDDFEPELTTEALRPLLADLRDALVPVVAAYGDPERPSYDGLFSGPWEPDVQHAVILELLEAVGFERDGWRLDASPHPFSQSLDPHDVRITTRYDPNNFGTALFSSLHEFGHGLYEAQIPRRLIRTPLGRAASLGVHESQSRLWENLVGRSRPFCGWFAPRLARRLPGLDGLDGDRLFRAVNTVEPSLIRVEADETTYNLHIILRFELELAMLEGGLAVDDVPQAWNEGMARLLGVAVPDDARGVLQDIHWGGGLIGYFPTYTLGSLMAAQLWVKVCAEVPGLDDEIAQGNFSLLREWLRGAVHESGRAFPPRELLRRATGQDLSIEPFMGYLTAKLEAAATA
jgi:carboxypeptidase Taq